MTTNYIKVVHRLGVRVFFIRARDNARVVVQKAIDYALQLWDDDCVHLGLRAKPARIVVWKHGVPGLASAQCVGLCDLCAHVIRFNPPRSAQIA